MQWINLNRQFSVSSRNGHSLPRGTVFLVACSGGVDSVALLHFMASNQDRMGIEVAAIHVDHMLRGEESAADGTFVKDYVKHGIPFFGGSVRFPKLLRKTVEMCKLFAGKDDMHFSRKSCKNMVIMFCHSASCRRPAGNSIDASDER